MSTRRRGLAFHEFRQLVERNQAPNAQITYYADPDINKDQIAIFDRGLPRRKGMDNFRGYEEEDHWVNSHVCELALFNGEVPMVGQLEERDPISNKLIKKTYRGALAALETMLAEGCLKKESDELRELFSTHGRTYKPPAA